ncbi:type IV toxin-antitoxin system YeeU family antitoxin [Citrobacter freundii]|uniref:Type IV toxin-antitoxin system YeeU family antitoxin n=1 Tax=Kluyvera intermedia TaxID=61648 RepID=A0AA95FZJ7_KLUIN|nr:MULTISPECIES: type IV toxin-antitoxin system YeeU family antitoxin [Enterobacteriaceae]EKV1389630.1 type IV toxin-antitoxin system YeeU family antitoxin [Citrobacter freundii]MDE9655360.1 type IV toxin-antitoxin system YeeU family antitoxin [Citrobacter freundii]WGL55736.1 type IV toxin-antitoxin system YeeU family antitoxin [Kluyvera intermedia]
MKSTDSENDSFLQWGLNCNVTPCFGARLVQEGNRLHYLADRACITGEFSNAESLKLDEVFTRFISQMESMLTTGEMNPRHAHCVTLYHNGFTCEADTLGSYGYVYITVYPTHR